MIFFIEQHPKHFFACLILIAFLTLQNGLVQAEVKLPKVFSNNMVLQRDIPIKLWGWADKKEKITVILHDDTLSVKVDRKGKWMAELPAREAGGPYELIISGENEIKLSNILFGDVWVCSGQSNMEWPMHSTNNAEEEIANATHPRIRLIAVEKKVSTKPLEDCESAGWVVCGPETVTNFSAVGYYFGRKLHDDLDVPIGLIHTSWGGTNVETWTSAPSIEKIEGFEGIAEELKSFDQEKIIAEQRAKLESITGPLPDQDEGMDGDQALWASEKTNYSSWKEMELPGLWETKLTNLDGIVWFEKEFELERMDLVGDVTIHLGKIDDSDITFLNGTEIGRTIQKYNESRVYLAPKKLLNIGKNTIVVRVEDTGGGGGIYGDPDDLYVKVENKKISLAGSWKYKIGRGDFSASISPNSMPSLLYNAMIHPIIPYGIKGAIWYQGESNAGRAYQYRTTFPNMITNWRQDWGLGDFPFFFVQLANYMAPVDEPAESAWAELREAQAMTLSLPNTGMATIIDIGAADDIHPRNKLDVGRRLALNALNKTYGKEVVFSGPTFKEMKVQGNRVTITYDNLGSGFYLKDKYGYVNGFSVAGKDRKFHWAKAYITGETVEVSCDKVAKPVAVRYGWANNPEDLNLFNMEGLPAVPFRTDDWPGVTIDQGYR